MQLSTISLDGYTSPRADEQKWGQVLKCLPSVVSANGYKKALAKSWLAGQRVAVVAVPESIGPRANFGRAGAETALAAFLPILANLQANDSVPHEKLLLVGQVNCTDLQHQAESLQANVSADLQQLRELVAELDSRVIEVLMPLFEQGFDVVLIGGGHNNAYPLLKSLAEVYQTSVGAMNLDPHADFRSCEGRHSGNGFRYAYEAGILQHYQVIGLHPAKNNAESLDALRTAGFNYTHLDILRTHAWSDLLPQWQQVATSWHGYFGIEVDFDVMTGMPASAMNYVGIEATQVLQFISMLAQIPHARYLHLTEAAPILHPAGLEAGNRLVGQVLTESLLAYLNARY